MCAAHVRRAIWDQVRVQYRVCEHNTLHSSLHHSFKSVSVTIWAPVIHGDSLQIFCALTKTSISVRFFTICSSSQKLAPKLKKRELSAHSVQIILAFTKCYIICGEELAVLYVVKNQVRAVCGEEPGSCRFFLWCSAPHMMFFLMFSTTKRRVLLHFGTNVSDNSCILSLCWSAACSRTSYTYRHTQTHTHTQTSYTF